MPKAKKPQPRPDADVLDRAALNRALLARQHLLTRTTRDPVAVIADLVGLQAQATPPPYVALSARIAGFSRDALAEALRARRVVRVALMRSTIHLVTADDCLFLRPLMQPAIERNFWKGSPYGKKLVGLDLPAATADARAMIDAAPCTTAALAEHLRARSPDRDRAALAALVRTYLPLVQLPPRGIWGEGGQPICATAETWLGRPLDAAPSREALVLRYLAAFGPASARDAQAWSGLAALDDVFEALRPRLVTFRDADGRELFDLPEAARPSAGTPAPPRFLPEYDNAFLSHADRTRIVSEADRKRFVGPNGYVGMPVLIDGFVGGAWRVTREGERATLVATPFARPSSATRDALVEEGARVLAFMEPDARHTVRVAK